MGASVTASADGRQDPEEKVVQSAAEWNENLNRERRDQRRCVLDLQTLTVHYPASRTARMARPNKRRLGHYPLALMVGQYGDYYERYTPAELCRLPLNTVLNKTCNSSSDSESDSDSSCSSYSSSSSETSDSDNSTPETASNGFIAETLAYDLGAAGRSIPCQTRDLTKQCKLCTAIRGRYTGNLAAQCVRCAYGNR